MRLLLDTHALLWAIDEPVKLSADAAANLHDPTNDLMVSAATVWEVAIKFGIKKLVLPQPYGVWMNQAIVDLKAESKIAADYRCLRGVPEQFARSSSGSV